MNFYEFLSMRKYVKKILQEKPCTLLYCLRYLHVSSILGKSETLRITSDYNYLSFKYLNIQELELGQQ